MTRLAIIIALCLPAVAGARTVASPKAAVPVIRLPAVYEDQGNTANSTPVALEK